jgi:hypothetical protein
MLGDKEKKGRMNEPSQGTNTMSALKILLCHLSENGEVSRKDLPAIVGSAGYAANLLRKYSDIMKVVGSKSNKTVRLMPITEKNEKQMARLIEDIDPLLFTKWKAESNSETHNWEDSGDRRQRAFKRARASYFMRKMSMDVDTYRRPALTTETVLEKWKDRYYYSAHDIKRAKKYGQNEINASAITGLLYLGGCAYSIYWFEIPDDLEKIRPGTEEKMRTHIRTLVMKYAERHDAESKAICIIPESIAKNISIETICKNIPKQYLDVYILTSDSEGAQQAFDVLSMSRHIRRAQLSIFNEDDIITTHRYDHAINKDTICQVGVIPNARALQYIKDKTKKGSQHNVWSIQKIPDYDIHILKGQHTLYQDLLPGQTGIILKSHNPDKLIGLMRSLEEDMLDF